jgi:methylenetetrahydrofolate reductase (NADPH)
MKIGELFHNKKRVVSCEIFPPKPDLPVSTIFQTLDELVGIPLDFISVTYGAGGSSTARSLEIAAKVKNHYQIETLAHLTCVGASRHDITEIVMALQRENIENILALRGDLPANMEQAAYQSDYRYATDLVKHLKELSDISIAAAAYPEGHIDCHDITTDIKYLAQKVHAGVDFLITQLFFDNELYFRFIDKARALGVTCPVSIGIMPILNVKQIERITNLCGATIPDRMRSMLEKYQDKPEDVAAAGVEYACEQIRALLDFGIDGVHLYTMNKAAHTKRILQDTGLLAPQQ